MQDNKEIWSEGKRVADARIKANLFRFAMSDEELQQPFSWHRYASSPRSSQALCISAFGSLRSDQLKSVSNSVLSKLVQGGLPAITGNQEWTVLLEHEDPSLLNEYGSQPSSIDALLISSTTVITVESKFVTDAAHGFGGCSRFSRKECLGYYGPGSSPDIPNAWCRLETWDGSRSPRLYWSLAKTFFRPEVFQMQQALELCRFRSSNYQLMRNFLFSATFARLHGKSNFGVIVMCPKSNDAVLQQQVSDFRTNILAEEHSQRISLVHYETLASLLAFSGFVHARELADYVQFKIRAVGL